MNHIPALWRGDSPQPRPFFQLLAENKLCVLSTFPSLGTPRFSHTRTARAHVYSFEAAPLTLCGDYLLVFKESLVRACLESQRAYMGGEAVGR